VRTLRSVYNYGHQVGTLHLPLLRGSGNSNSSGSGSASSSGDASTDGGATAASATEAAHSSPIALAEIPAHNRTCVCFGCCWLLLFCVVGWLLFVCCLCACAARSPRCSAPGNKC
jgi:hypothetical protein